MTWVYDVNKKSFTLDGVYKFDSNYAGAEGYKDDVKFECEKGKGPLPRGRYKIGNPIQRHPTAGAYVLRLTPYKSNEMCGRAGFLIHGDNTEGTASTGCIVLIRNHRRTIAISGDKELLVL
ncbi:tlde1 domain-containing protein [Erwinia sp.]|uniref:tlde1 domain-containing protein n=1 Tax=Erwinia citreus TaxID=558 RepID=UPI003C727E26